MYSVFGDGGRKVERRKKGRVRDKRKRDCVEREGSERR